MVSAPRTCWLVAAIVAVGVSGARAAEGVEEIAAAINAERALLDRPPMSSSAALARLAKERADEISEGQALDFELTPGPELLVRAKALGYTGLMVQELATVDDGSSCDVVQGWNGRLGASDGYRRHEAADIGIARGWVGESPLTIVVVGVPSSSDPLRKRWPGVAPREHALHDLSAFVDDSRFRQGLPRFERSEDLDTAAQELADRILADPRRTGGGALAFGTSTALFYKGANLRVQTPGAALVDWLQFQRDVIVGKDAAAEGLGLASRGQNDHLEAVWVLLVRPGRP